MKEQIRRMVLKDRSDLEAAITEVWGRWLKFKVAKIKIKIFSTKKGESSSHHVVLPVFH